MFNVVEFQFMPIWFHSFADAHHSERLVQTQEQGNECVRNGKKHYSEAIDCYTKAINQGVLSDSETSILFSNRAHVNLLLGNYRRALTDAEESMRLSPDNVKVTTTFLEEKKTFLFDLVVAFWSFPDVFQCFKRQCIELQRHQCHWIC